MKKQQQKETSFSQNVLDFTDGYNTRNKEVLKLLKEFFEVNENLINEHDFEYFECGYDDIRKLLNNLVLENSSPIRTSKKVRHNHGVVNKEKNK